MATAERKARKRAGIKFERTPKEATPRSKRVYVTQPVQSPPGTLYTGKTRYRSPKKVQKYLDGVDQFPVYPTV